MHSKPVGWFQIYVRDMARAKAFYGAVFGFAFEKLESPDPEMELWAFPGPMDNGHGASGALVRWCAWMTAPQARATRSSTSCATTTRWKPAGSGRAVVS